MACLEFVIFRDREEKRNMHFFTTFSKHAAQGLVVTGATVAHAVVHYAGYLSLHGSPADPAGWWPLDISLDANLENAAE